MKSNRTDRVIQQAVIANRLDSIAGEMGMVLERSARSPIFAEACDFACGICNANGELVSQLSGIPILAAAGSFSVQAVLKRYGRRIEDGDVFIVNDPYYGGNHLPDIGIITPVFTDNELLFFCVSRAHHGDIGGSTAGSYNSKATEIFQEGLRIPPVKLVSQGTLIEEVLEMISYNTRNPKMLKSDLKAQMGANHIGRRRILEMIAAYSASTVRRTTAEILNQAEELTRSRIMSLPDGVYEGIELVDDDGFQNEAICIKAKVIKTGSNLTVDFSGTDCQVKGFVNSSIVTTTTAAYIAILWVLGPDIPRNGGAFRTIGINAPAGSLVNPKASAPVTLCTLTPASEIIASIFKALAPVARRQVPSGFGRFCGPSFSGVDPRTEQFYVGFAFCALGSGGAMQGRDGSPYMAPMSNYGGVRTPNIESNEVQYPHITICHELETDTAGAGCYRGGAGIRYSLCFYNPRPGIVMFGDGMKNPPYGLNGGQPGSLNRAQLRMADGTIALRSKEDLRQLASGDTIELVSSGGGGWGNPFERDPNKVFNDILDGIVSPEMARTVYGVAIGPKGIDSEKTRRLRQEQSAQTGENQL